LSDRAPHLFLVRVYYEDTDFSGAVYHASYLRFMERGRTEWLRALGIAQSALAAAPGRQAFGFAVRHMDIDFRAPARMDDLLTVETRVAKIGGASLDLAQRVLRGEDVLIAAAVRIACVAGGRPARLPAALRAKLAG
jgi:acyl-CoA thioester hydrolase